MRDFNAILEFKQNGKWLDYGGIYCGKSRIEFTYNFGKKLVKMPTLTDAQGIASPTPVEVLPEDASDTTLFAYAVDELSYRIQNISVFDKEAVEKLFALYFRTFPNVPRGIITRDMEASEDMRVIIWHLGSGSGSSDAELYLTHSISASDNEECTLSEADLAFPALMQRQACM